MASSGERRLVFDTRGKRKHVVRVVYAILALLMGVSLFLVVGPVNIGALLGNSSSGSSAAGVLHEQAERIERRLAKSPDDEQLLLALTRAQIGAGNAQIEVASETEIPTVPASARKDFKAASQSWSRYLKQAGDEPSATAAQLVAGTFFRLAESSTSLGDAASNVAMATAAQEIAVEQQPTLGSLSTLAIYEYFNGDFAAGDKAAKETVAKVTSKTEAKNIEKQLAKYRKSGKKLEQQKKQVAEVQSKVQKGLNKGQPQNPLGGLGGLSGGSLGE